MKSENDKVREKERHVDNTNARPGRNAVMAAFPPVSGTFFFGRKVSYEDDIDVVEVA